jgi:hypothetical protein
MYPNKEIKCSEKFHTEAAPEDAEDSAPEVRDAALDEPVAIEEAIADELAMVETGVAELDAPPEPAATKVQIWLVID